MFVARSAEAVERHHRMHVHDKTSTFFQVGADAGGAGAGSGLHLKQDKTLT